MRIASIVLCLLSLFELFASWKLNIIHPIVIPQRSRLYQQRDAFIPTNFYSRLDQGLVSAQELESLFSLSKYELSDIEYPLSKGFVGFVFSLENCLIDAKDMFISSFVKLSKANNQRIPSKQDILASIGLPFLDSVKSFPWDDSATHDDNQLQHYEIQFYSLLKDYILHHTIKPIEGVMPLIEKILEEKNDIAVISFLPRDLAQLLLSKVKLARVFQHQIPPRQLITLPSTTTLVEEYTLARRSKAKGREEEEEIQSSDSLSQAYHHNTDHTSLYTGQQYTKSRFLAACGYMKKVPGQCLAFVGQPSQIMHAKQLGMTCIALEGYTSDWMVLRYANRIMASYGTTEESMVMNKMMKDCYEMARKNIRIAQGPVHQLDLQTVTSSNHNNNGGYDTINTNTIRSHSMVCTPLIQPKQLIKRKLSRLAHCVEELQTQKIELTDEMIEQYLQHAQQQRQRMQGRDTDDEEDGVNVYNYDMNKKQHGIPEELPKDVAMGYWANHEPDDLYRDANEAQKVRRKRQNDVKADRKAWIDKQIHRVVQLVQQINYLQKEIDVQEKEEREQREADGEDDEDENDREEEEEEEYEDDEDYDEDEEDEAWEEILESQEDDESENNDDTDDDDDDGDDYED